MSGVRWHAVARIIYGGALLGCTTQTLQLLHAPRDDRWAVTVARVLGVRHLLQAAITLAAPTRKVVLAGAIADFLHGASDVAAAVAEPRWRPAATADAVVAFTSAGTAAMEEVGEYWASSAVE